MRRIAHKPPKGYNMKILALDSTAGTASVALCDGHRLLSLWLLNNGLTHSERLLPMVESTLEASGVNVCDIDLFAVSAGPGSFTGVRIGVATVKGLAYGRGKPCIGVSTLHALAYNLISSDGIVCPVMNARRGQVYNALFDCRNGKLIRLTDDRAISLTDLDAQLGTITDRKIYLCGDGYDIAKQTLTSPALCDTPDLQIWQNACSVAQTALDLYERGLRTSDAELAPIYLRLPQAERERLGGRP